MQAITLDLQQPPPRWQIVWELCTIAAEVTGVPRARVLPTSRVIEDLGMDSLCLVEFIMKVEERYGVQFPDGPGETPALKQVFTRSPLLMADMAQIVELVWDTRGEPIQRRRFRRRVGSAKPAPPSTLPFLQLDGRLPKAEWLKGSLYEPLSRDGGGIVQLRRRTDGMRCILIPSGTIQLGAREEDLDAEIDERPARLATFSSFIIDAEPVSATTYARFLNSVGPVADSVLHEWFIPAPLDARREHLPIQRRWGKWRAIDAAACKPMMLVSWFGANAYSLWANRRDWRAYRGDAKPAIPGSAEAPAPPQQTLFSMLPSEGQWEYAARGTDERRFPWGNNPPSPETICAAQHAPGQDYTAESIPAADVNTPLGLSPFGLHHMAGNVWQWCRDWYAPDFYKRSEAAAADPQNAEPTGVRSERGGSWVGPAHLARSAYRRGRAPEARGRCLGFRCIGSVDDLSAEAKESVSHR